MQVLDKVASLVVGIAGIGLSGGAAWTAVAAEATQGLCGGRVAARGRRAVLRDVPQRADAGGAAVVGRAGYGRRGRGRRGLGTGYPEAAWGDDAPAGRAPARPGDL